MANREHVQVVRKGAKALQRWRGANAGERLDVSDGDLSGVDLHEADLSGADLSGADLTDADLAGSDFRGADLRATIFARANLSESDLRGANLRQASLPNAELHAVRLEDANLVQANLRGANLSASHLRRANLRRAKLEDANLSRADLADADLCSASLASADLYSASLRGVHLRDSALSGAILTYADMSKADLRNASIGRARFEHTLLKEANFAGAMVNGTIFANTDLSGILGLDRVVHYGPSTIGANTLATSRGHIDLAFLRGCGLSEWEIIATRLHSPEISSDEIQRVLYEINLLRAAMPIQIRPLFLSYSHADSDFVDRLDARLKESGIRFWRDTHDMRAGRVEKQLTRGISLNPTVIIILSKDSVNSDWVEWEVATARALEKDLRRDVLCPIALDPAWKTCGWSGPLRRQIEDYHILDFSGWVETPIFEQQFARLINGLALFYEKSEPAS